MIDFELFIHSAMDCYKSNGPNSYIHITYSYIAMYLTAFDHAWYFLFPMQHLQLAH